MLKQKFPDAGTQEDTQDVKVYFYNVNKFQNEKRKSMENTGTLYVTQVHCM